MNSIMVDRRPRTASRQITALSAAKLRETVRLLTMAEGLANFGHWRFDSDSEVMELSPQAARICGRARNEELSVQQALRLIAPPDRRDVIKAAAKALAGQSHVSCDVRLLRGRQLRHVVIQIQADEAEGRTPKCLFGVIRDVTTKIVSHEKLVAARNEAEAATRAKSEFLATMSHEIRTPMTGVMGMIDLLRSSPTEADRERYLSAMKQSAELLLTVLDGILDFSKAESGKIEVHPRHFDLESVARRTIDMFHNAASKKGLLFDLQFNPGTSPIVVGDPVRIQQVVSNLISNAVKFTPAGQVTATFDATPISATHQRWRVTIADTGVGIDEQSLTRLFEPFVQIGDRNVGGTGLGLAISRRIVEAMGGRTGVDSREGHGSTFWFDLELPIGRVEGVEPAEMAAEMVRGEPLHILVAEDNPTNQMLVAALVRRLGHRVTCVENGRVALEAARSTPFDCILMDMQMPELDGVAATRAIRSTGGRNAVIPIIALTADAAPERRRFYENIGLTDFMTKPISVAGLRSCLQRMPALGALALTKGSQDRGIDPERLEELGEILGMPKVEALLQLLATELRNRPLAITAAADAGDFVALRAHAHSLKGAIANFGGSGAAMAAQAVELAAPGVELELALERLKIEVAQFAASLEVLQTARASAAILAAERQTAAI